MDDINPYESTPPTEDGIASNEPSRDACPACLQPVSRWRVWNSIWSGKCDYCGEKLWLELPTPFVVLLVAVGLCICGLRWAISEGSVSSDYPFVFVVMPLSMVVLSSWMQISFGRLVSTATCSNPNRSKGSGIEMPTRTK